MQVEKPTKQSEAEAIRKMLGLDTEKKKEEKKQKEPEEKEKAARAQELAGRTIRWVMGPTGTVVSFLDELGLPNIFNSKPSCYPPPREKCAGPWCTNAYRYRDSKLKLPLCSLKCYRAVHGNARWDFLLRCCVQLCRRLINTRWLASPGDAQLCLYSDERSNKHLFARNGA